jgi:peptide chain release factor 3
MTTIQNEVARRRTFAIISHPDAGKTTLTEKLLLFGGAIQLAGAVKARGRARQTRSDWMKVEAERGISVASSVMTYEYGGCTFNLLDTPGHEDFSEDTYRTLSAVDSAVMVLDCARGIEAQTRKLFEVCRLRDVPIITFVNKLDREGREPFELLQEIEETLALDVTPASWPIGMGRNFHGCYDVLRDQLVLIGKGESKEDAQTEKCSGLDDPKLDELLPADAVARLRDELPMAQELCPPLDLDAYRAGHLTPVYFGSALNNFGVREVLSGIIDMAPPPQPVETDDRPVQPDEEKVSGFVFKIQANMDPKHRDRIAFFRLASGHFKRGMKLHHVRSSKQIAPSNPILFLAQERGTAEDAYAGDIIGIPNHGNLRIGDSLTEGEGLHFQGIPSFAPELLQAVRLEDPMRAKQLTNALLQLAEEGVARVFKRRLGSDWIVGVLGQLQFEVMADRIRTEYEVKARFERTELFTARWVEADDHLELKKFSDKNSAEMADDHDGSPVFLARNAWALDRAVKDWPNIRFLKTKEQTR